MDLRKTLIDFGNELQKIGFNYYDDVEVIVDIYLKSINGGSTETQAVRQNEHTEEFNSCLKTCTTVGTCKRYGCAVITYKIRNKN